MAGLPSLCFNSQVPSTNPGTPEASGPDHHSQSCMLSYTFVLRVIFKNVFGFKK
jgi:hypothetical protein